MLVAGQACLIVALVCAVYGAAASLYGARTRKRQFVAAEEAAKAERRGLWASRESIDSSNAVRPPEPLAD